MKRKIKIIRKTLKESNNKIPMDEATLPPKGRKGPPTEKFNPDGGPEFRTSYKEIPYTQKAGPTIKASPEEIASVLSDVIQDKGILARAMDYITDLLKPAPADQPEMELEPEEVATDFSGPQIKIPDPADIPMAAGVPLQEPEEMDQPVEPEEEIDLEMYKFQEAMKRHFKKRD